MVAAVVVVGCAASPKALVPNVLERAHRGGLSILDFVDQAFIELLAIMLSGRVDVQCFVKKVVACVNNVDKVLDGCEVVSCAVEVDVDSAAGVYEGASVSKLSDDLLQGVDILLVSQDRGNQFAFVKVCRPGDLAVNLLLRGNARIEHYFPNSAVWRGDVVGVVSASDVANRSVQLLGNNLCRFVSGDACELDFCSESCV